MTTKLKNRLQKMHFQKQIQRRTKVEESTVDKYTEQLYANKVNELLGIQTHENIQSDTRGSLRPQHI
jgi:hypothetical protein